MWTIVTRKKTSSKPQVRIVRPFNVHKTHGNKEYDKQYALILWNKTP